MENEKSQVMQKKKDTKAKIRMQQEFKVDKSKCIKRLEKEMKLKQAR